MGQPRLNARATRTRSALHRAFASLIQSNRYENLEVAHITNRAGVSRSTFYAHYSSKDALLAESIARPFAVLADTIQPVFTESKLITLLEHFWENRGLTRGILVGPARRKTIEVLIRLIEERLKSAGLHRRGALILPPRLVAIQLAEILLAPVTAWLLGESRCSSDALAAALRRVSIAVVNSMTTCPTGPRVRPLAMPPPT
jgi:AcrR family transcriptional regulator